MFTNGASRSLFERVAMGRAPCCDKDNVKRGPWSPEEDAALKSYLETHGTGGNWIALPRKAGLRRCGKSCRLRWLNYLRPDIKHGGFTEEEDSIIYTLYAQMGSRWSVIASKLSGRTDNDVKNYWNTKLKKKILAGKVSLNKPLNNNDTLLPSMTPSSLIQDVSDFPASSQNQNPPLPSLLPFLDDNNGASSGFNNIIHEENMGVDQFHLMDVVSEIGASSGNNNSMVSLLSQEGSSISDSSNKCLSLPPEHDVDVEMMDFGFGFPYDLANCHDRVGEFTPSYYYPEWVDFSHADIKPH